MSSTRDTSRRCVGVERRSIGFTFVVLLAAGIARRASADPTPASQSASKDAAMAQTLFDQAKDSMASGDYAAACPKLAESYRLDPGSGTLTALAVCHENVGKTATAWAEYVEVASEAKQQGRPDREAFAQLHIAALDPKVPRLTIQVAPESARLPSLQVKRDGVLVGPAGWGMATPVDPGDHLIEVSAPDKQSWSAHVSLSADGDKEVLAVPPLQDVPQETTATTAPVDQAPKQAAASAGAESSARETSGSMRTVGLVVGGTGAAALIVGTVFGVEAISKSSSAKNECPSQSCANLSAVQENNGAKTDALASNVFVIAGLAALGAGAYLYFTAPPTTSAAAPRSGWTRLVPLVGLRTGGLSVQGAW